MIHAILFDLDDTLLDNGMEQFVPAYLAALSQYMADLFPAETFVRHLLRATEEMTINTDPHRTNMEVFDATFFPALGYTRAELEPRFEHFYAVHFPQLRRLTHPRPSARPVMDWVFAHGFQVAIATNPLFPRAAIEQRLEWAGVPASEFPYRLITSYENMHATKPHRAYYLEIARQLGQQPETCLVVGDDWAMDIRPAMASGMSAYWIAAPDQPSPAEEAPPTGQGSLADFAHWVKSNT